MLVPSVTATPILWVFVVSLSSCFVRSTIPDTESMLKNGVAGVILYVITSAVSASVAATVAIVVPTLEFSVTFTL